MTGYESPERFATRTRRGFLRTLSATTGIAIAGCAGSEEGTNPSPGGNPSRAFEPGLGGPGNLDTVEPYSPANVTGGATITEGDYRDGEETTRRTETDSSPPTGTTRTETAV